MAKRHQHSKQAGGTGSGPEARRREIERLIESGRAKEAFKEAKLLFRQDASAESRLLVERTYLRRIETLISGGMSESAREVAGSFLEFGVTNSDLRQTLILLLPQVGMTDQALALQCAITSPELQASLAVKLADRAVLHPEDAPASMPELRAEVAKVRGALAALESGNDAQAMELLQSIPRGSHLADWRLFVRGLAAFRRSDPEQARASWSRLDPQRTAHKIADRLLPATSTEKHTSHHKHLTALETCAFGEPLLERLNQLQTALKAADWVRVRRLVGPLQLSLRRVEPRWSQRLTEMMLPLLAAEFSRVKIGNPEHRVGEVIGALEPLTWDPHWNRFRALLRESESGNTEDALTYWKRYLEDLNHCSTVLEAEPRIVQAMVLRRIASMYDDLADDDDEDYGDFYDDPYDDFDEDDEDGQFHPREDGDSAAQEFHDSAVAALEKSLQLDPTQRTTHLQLIELHQLHEEPERAAEAQRKLLDAFPDDVETMRRLITYYQGRDEPEPVLLYIERIRAIKPLDNSILDTEVWARFSNARHLAIAKHFEEGREELARAVAIPNIFLPPYRTITRRAAFEFKAGSETDAEEFVRQATELLDEPTAAWLSLSIEAARYKLSKPLQQRFNKQFKDALARKVTSKTAGLLAATIVSYVNPAIDYTGRAGHLREIVRYLKRTIRTKYDESELRNVCVFLHQLDNEKSLEEKLANRGLKLFPSSPFFLHLTAMFDLSRGPFASDPTRSQAQLKQAFDLAQASQDPRDTQLIPSIKSALSRMEDIREAMSRFSSGPGPRPNMLPMIEDFLESLQDQFLDGADIDDPADEGPARKHRKEW
jgi:tetratricopeptide (TPR) repeat protein